MKLKNAFRPLPRGKTSRNQQSQQGLKRVGGGDRMVVNENTPNRPNQPSNRTMESSDGGTSSHSSPSSEVLSPVLVVEPVRSHGKKAKSKNGGLRRTSSAVRIRSLARGILQDTTSKGADRRRWGKSLGHAFATPQKSSSKNNKPQHSTPLQMISGPPRERERNRRSVVLVSGTFHTGDSVDSDPRSTENAHQVTLHARQTGGGPRAVIDTARACSMPSTLVLTTAERDAGDFSVESPMSGESFAFKANYLSGFEENAAELADADQQNESALLAPFDDYYIGEDFFANDETPQHANTGGRSWSPAKASPHPKAWSPARSIGNPFFSEEDATANESTLHGLSTADDSFFDDSMLSQRAPQISLVRTKSADVALSQWGQHDDLKLPQPARVRSKSLGTGDMPRSSAHQQDISLHSIEVLGAETDDEPDKELNETDITVGTIMNASFAQLPSLPSDKNESSSDDASNACTRRKERVVSAIARHGEDHVCVGEAWLDLGIAQAHALAFSDSIASLESAAAILRPRKQRSLELARVLYHLGMTYHKANSCSSHTPCEPSLACLDEALRIRFDRLGPLHPDTVDTVNSIGGVYMMAHKFDEARRIYMEVVTVRQAIFGIFHPSVAVAAHAVANAAHHLGNLDEATLYYCKALDVYESHNLHQNHPSMCRLLRDMKRMQRLRET